MIRGPDLVEKGAVTGQFMISACIGNAGRAPMATLEDQIEAGGELMAGMAAPIQRGAPVCGVDLSGEQFPAPK